MIALIQRVSSASVTVEGSVVGEIDKGLLILLALSRAMTNKKPRDSANACWVTAYSVTMTGR